MIFSVDSHYVIGKTHIKGNKPCQDHALSKLMGEDFAVIVVSDGCSSGEYTEIGSMIISCAALKAIEGCRGDVDGFYRLHNVMPQYIHDTLMVIVERAQVLLSRGYRDFLATCVYSVVNSNGGFIHMLGDGCTAIKYKNGDVSFVKAEWENNMPFYPIYSNERKETFISDHEKFEDGLKALKISEYLIDASGTCDIEEDKYIPINEAVNGYVIPITKEDLSKIETICIFSDGLEDFRKVNDNAILERQDPVTTSLMKQFISFKNFEGEFVKRRLSRALIELSKDGIDPHDDFSMSAIHVKENTKK